MKLTRRNALAAAMAGATAAAPAAGQPQSTKYYVAFLYKGPRFASEILDTPENRARSKRHGAFVGKMTAEGKFVAFGPFSDSGDLRGMYVMKASSLEEAREWANEEPAVKTGMIEMRVYAWHGTIATGATAAASSR